MQRIHTDNCLVGLYVVLMNGAQHDTTYRDYVDAERNAEALSRKNPGQHVFVAQINTQLLGVPHVYEIHGKQDG